MLGTKISQVQSTGLPSVFLRAWPCVHICTGQKNGRKEDLKGLFLPSAPTFFMMRVFNESLHSWCGITSKQKGQFSEQVAYLRLNGILILAAQRLTCDV